MANEPFERIEAARQGDGAALGKMLESLRGELLLKASRGIGQGMATKIGPSDIVQETFLAAHRGIERFRGTTHEEWRAWLEAILVNQLANLRRACLDTKKRRGEPAANGGETALHDPPGDSRSTPSRQLQQRERDFALEAALNRLPDRYQQVIRWHHDDGLTFEAIGGRLGISGDAVRKLWARALVSLKRELGPDHDPR